MTRTINRILAAVALGALFLAGSSAHAAAVIWDIDQTQSKVTLKILDQVTSGQKVGLRNQTGSGSSWTVGNTASVDGSLVSNYSEGGSLQFNVGSSIAGLNSGNYRPNPAVYDPGPPDSKVPAGFYTNTSTAAGVFGGKVVAPDLLGATFAYLAFRNVNLGISSSAMPFIGNTFNTAAGLNFGIGSAALDIDGVSFDIPEAVIPDTLNNPVNSIGANASSGGTIANLGGFNRTITIPINVPITIDFGGTILNATLTGQIVATAAVPEPSTLMMGGIGLVSLGVWARRRKLHRASNELRRNK